MSLLAKIKSRGYLEIVIGPTRFVEKRVENVLDLREIARSQRVEIRGWDFPHYGHSDPKVAKDHIEQEVDYLRHVEAWRLYQSGLFIYMGGVCEDWDEQDRPTGSHVRWVQRPGEILRVADTIWILTEAFEFAARLSMTGAGSDRMHVVATLHGLEGRKLHMEIQSRYLSQRPPVEGHSEFDLAEDFSRERLVAESKALALAWAREVFRRFGWDASPEILGEIQSQRA
jgi:hypothetical protein